MKKAILAVIAMAMAACAGGEGYAGPELGQTEQAITKDYRWGLTDVMSRCGPSMPANAPCYLPDDKTVRYSVNNAGMTYFEGMSFASEVSRAVAKIQTAQGSSSQKYTFVFEATPANADVVFYKGGVSGVTFGAEDIRSYSRVQCQDIGLGFALWEPTPIAGKHYICEQFIATLDMGDMYSRAGSSNFANLLEHGIGFGLLGAIGLGVTPSLHVGHTFTSRQLEPFGKTVAHSLQEQCLSQQVHLSYQPGYINVDGRCNPYF